MSKSSKTTLMIIVLVILLAIPIASFLLKTKESQLIEKETTSNTTAGNKKTTKSPETSTKTMGNKPTEQQNDSVIVTYPKPNTVVHSPLVIKGKAKGTWFFEGSFPITLYYGVHGDVASTHATAQGAWMTEDYVPFTATIEFPTPKWKEGDLVLERANQSGLEENNDEIKVPVRFR